jgi:hypothetical protein
MRAALLVVLVSAAFQAQAYDGRIGDAVVELRSGYVGNSLDLSQMLLPNWRGGLVLSQAWRGQQMPFGLGMVLAYEGHRRGYALLPRARLATAMALVQDGGLGLNVQLDAGLLWYVLRSAGVGLSLGAQLWGSTLAPDASLSLVARW